MTTRYAVLADLDGVLLDSGPAVRAALAATATCATGRRVAVADLPADALARPRTDVLAGLGVLDPDQACTRWWDGALAAAPNPLFPGVTEGLRALRGAGAALAVVTLQHRDRLPWLIPPELHELLDAVITPQHAAPKPSPDGLRAALDLLGVAPENAFMLGDSPSDIAAALAAGVLPIAAAWGWHEPDQLRTAGAHYVLGDSHEIGPKLLRRLAPLPGG
jgi:phosphoglycolate phosphatase-like HAD superfamily hydrolase